MSNESKPTYLLSVDLGQAADYTALCIDEIPPDMSKRERLHHVRHLERFPLGTPYPKQVTRIVELYKRLPSCTLIVDMTGVGRPIVDMLRQQGLTPVAITITGGDSVGVDKKSREYRVPKRELVSAVQVLLQSKRLKIADKLPDAETLRDEMQAFKVEISKSGHDSYSNDWRENPHDDLVLAVAMAAWYGQQATEPRMWILDGSFFGSPRLRTDTYIRRIAWGGSGSFDKWLRTGED